MNVHNKTTAPPEPFIDDPKMWRASRQEMERRWTLVRNRLVERQIEALIVQGYEDKIGGYVKWLTDNPPGYPRTIIFHADGPMTIIDHGAQGQHREVKNNPDQPGVGEIVTTWAFQVAHYTNHLNAAAVIDVLKARSYRRIAVANPSGMPHGFISGLQAGLTGVAEVIDETDFLDLVKARKSAEEIALIRRSAAIQDEVFREVLAYIEPGVRDFELNAFAKYRLELRGTERGVYIGRSAPLGQPAAFGYRHFQGRTLREGDHICLLLESNSRGGLWTEMGRIITLGPPPSSLVDAFEEAKAAQAETAKLLVPGALASDVFEAFNDFKTSRGGAPEQRIHAHGQGYDSVERPLIRSDETMKLEPGFSIAVHPSHVTESAFGHICDNWLIDLDGAGSFIHATPKQIFEL